jgi:hypothetical protein
MRSLGLSVTVVVACVLQACQSADSGKPTAQVARAAVVERNAATTHAQQNARLKEQARAYAARLNQGRCATSEEAMLFDVASQESETSLRTTIDPTGVPDAQLAAEAEQALAEARLDVGDAARIGGCSDIANAQYRIVLRSFPGPANVAYRRRAELGLSAMQL